MNKVAVIGGGIAGLGCAYGLCRKGIDFTVFEKTGNLGGVIQSRNVNGFLLESGPSSLLLKDKRIEKLLNELNLNYISANEHSKNRYILKNGRPIKLPLSPFQAISSPIISTKAKLKLLKEPFVTPFEIDEFVSDFFSRRLGDEVQDYLVDPFIAGTFAGNPKQLSIKHAFPFLKQMEIEHGSIIKGFWKNRKLTDSYKRKREIVSFNGGMQELPQALEGKMSDRLFLNSDVKDIIKTEKGFGVKVDKSEKAESYEFDSVIIATETYGIPQLLKRFNDHEFEDAISSIYYPPVAVLHFGVSSSKIKNPLYGFGILIPKLENRNILGILFNSDMFPERAPKDHTLLTVFTGGARQPEIIHQIGNLQAMAWKDVQSILKIEGEPDYYHEKIYQKAIPQYTLGYENILKQINSIEEKNPGLFFTGNYLSGISVPDTILNGMDCSEKIVAFLQNELAN